MKQLLPQNYRVIPAKHWYLLAGALFEGVSFVFLLGLVFYLIYQYNQAQIVREKELKSLASWEKLVTKYPNYPEIYYNAALYEARVGDRQKALLNLGESLKLNPNFEPSVELQKQLSK